MLAACRHRRFRCRRRRWDGRLPYSSLLRRIYRRWPSSSVDCRISSPMQLLPPLFYVPIRHMPRCAVAVIGCRHAPCRAVGILKAASRAFLLIPFYILPLVDCNVSPLGALPDVHLPTNHDGFINAVSPEQLPPAAKTNAICVGLKSVPPPLISSIPTSSVTAADVFHLEVHPHPSIYFLGNHFCQRNRQTLSTLIRRQIDLDVGGRPLADARQRIDVVGLVRNVFVAKVTCCYGELLALLVYLTWLLHWFPSSNPTSFRAFLG